MRSIRIGFSRPKDKAFPIGSWLIRLYNGTPYSHVYLKFYSESLDRWLVYEAVGSGVRFVGSHLWESHAKEVKHFDIELTDSEYRTIMQFCVDKAGSDYGFMQNIGIAIADLFNMNYNPFRKGKNCSEAIAEILALKGYAIPKPLDLMSPKDVDLVLTTQSI